MPSLKGRVLLEEADKKVSHDSLSVPSCSICLDRLKLMYA